MSKPLRKILMFSISAVLATTAQAAAYPERAVSWVVPYPPGGSTDTVSRILAEAFSHELKQPFVVENKPGASGTIGVRHTIRSSPDGYTLSVFASPSLTAPYMLSQSPYNSETDLTPVGLAYYTPPVFVINPTLLPDVKNMIDLIAYAKENGLIYTTAGIGSIGHLSIELLGSELGFETTHIPFQGSNPAITSVIAGDIPLMVSEPVTALPHVNSGKLKAIAVNAKERLASYPDVPLLTEQGINQLNAVSWAGLFVANNTPKETITLLNNTLQKIIEKPDIAQKMIQLGAYPYYSSAAHMQRTIKTDSATWKKVIDDNQIASK